MVWEIHTLGHLQIGTVTSSRLDRSYISPFIRNRPCPCHLDTRRIFPIMPQKDATIDVLKYLKSQLRNLTGPSAIARLTQIHDDTLMDLLPQVGAEDLDQGDLQGGDLASRKWSA